MVAQGSAEVARVAILCALQHEYDAVRELLVGEETRTAKDGTRYRVARIRDLADRTDPSPWLVGLHLTGKGQTDATLETSFFVQDFQPEIALFVGVAGGRPGKVKVGDVVVASEIAYYERGKVTHSGFVLRPRTSSPSRRLLQSARFEASDSTWKHQIKTQDIELSSVHIAPIVSGEKVVTDRNSTLWSMIERNFDEAVAVEMEGHGMMCATHSHCVEGIIIRGISDLLDNKNEPVSIGEAIDLDRQRMAARHAAKFGITMVTNLAPKGVTEDSLEKNVRPVIISLKCSKIELQLDVLKRISNDPGIEIEVFEHSER